MPFGFALGALCVECCINYRRWWAERHGAAAVGRWRSGDLSRAGGPSPVYSSIACFMAAELARSSYSFHFWEYLFLLFARYHVIAFLNPAVLLRLDRLAAMVSKRYSQKWNNFLGLGAACLPPRARFACLVVMRPFVSLAIAQVENCAFHYQGGCTRWNRGFGEGMRRGSAQRCGRPEFAPGVGSGPGMAQTPYTAAPCSARRRSYSVSGCSGCSARVSFDAQSTR